MVDHEAINIGEHNDPTTEPAPMSENQERELWDIAWKNLNYKIPVKKPVKNPIRDLFTKREVTWKEVLREVSGEVKAGEVVAIMGGSGAGKSTLLNSISGRLRQGKLTGSISVNGQKRDQRWQRLAAYVEQQDIMYPALTVKETVEFAAMLKLPRGMTKSEKDMHVQKTIAMLGLTLLADSRIGDNENRGISGGEKKRVSIAVELVTDPSILFLDEPTSGLDSFTALNISKTIADLAKAGKRTVLLTIHQPRMSILENFSKIILLSDGQIIFYGSTQEALEHFESLGMKCPPHENPADFFIDAITIDMRTDLSRQASLRKVRHMSRMWVESDKAQVPMAEVAESLNLKSEWSVSRVVETAILMQRDFRVKFRDTRSLLGEVAQTFIITFLLSFTFFMLGDNFGAVQSRIGLLFFVCANWYFGIVTQLIPTFTLDRDIILRERYSNTYRPLSAFIAKFISYLPIRAVMMTFFAVVLYYITGLRTDGFQYFLIFYGFVLLMGLCATSLALLIAASVPSVEVGVIVAPLVMVIFLVYGGELANSGEITWILRWIQYISPVFYNYLGFAQNEMAGQQFGEVSGDQYLELYGLNQVPIIWCMGGLLILSGVYLILGYFALAWNTRPKTIII
jgi:ABC-type multidrug transport system ATPase subunit